jgi:Tfp pilus assembly major pilin PilA
MTSGTASPRVEVTPVITNSAAPLPIRAAATPQLTPVNREPETSSPKEPIDLFSPVVSRLRDEEKKLRSAAIALRDEVRKQCSHALGTLDLRERYVRFLRSGKILMQNGSARCRDASANSLSAAKSFWNSSIARAREFSQGATTPENTVVESSPTPAVSEAQTFTISQAAGRLTKLSLRAKILFAQQLSKWEMTHPTPNQVRLWSSMTMAAVAAILALAIISLVPHYAQKSLPSRVLATSSAGKANDANANATKPLEKNMKTKANHPQGSAASQKATRPKPRRSENGDYVAPNTYKYYGNRSQASR